MRKGRTRRPFSRTNVEYLSGPVTIKRPGQEPYQMRRVPKHLRWMVYLRDRGQCQYCGRDLSFYRAVVDHVEPYYHGGETVLRNLVLACRECNDLKGAQRIPKELQPTTTYGPLSLSPADTPIVDRPGA